MRSMAFVKSAIVTSDAFRPVASSAASLTRLARSGYGAIPSFYTENFPTRYRASGASAGYQVSQVYGGGLIPIIAGLLLNAYGIHEAYIYIGGLVMLYAVLAIFAILATPETKHVNIEG
jgi:fucose permease